MIAETLQHLTDDGIMVVQFGELDFANAPNRTARYVDDGARGARGARHQGPEQPHDRVGVSSRNTTGDLSTIILKRTPFTPAEVARLRDGACRRSRSRRRSWAPGRRPVPTHRAAARGGSRRRRPKRSPPTYPRQISAVTDDAPFFWHFSRLRRRAAQHLPAARRRATPRTRSASACCSCCSASRSLYAAIFLLAPFFFVRKEWRALPAKGISARLLRRARARLHVLRDHDDPAARAVPRVSRPTR